MQLVPLPEVSRAAVATCLALVEARDPLVIPADPTLVSAADGFAVVDGQAVVGLGWREPCPCGTCLEIRVPPGHRRRGVGSALLERLVDGRRDVFAGFDAGHPRVARFVSRRGFVPLGVVLHQRWDGEATEVPGAFQSADLRGDLPAETAWALLQEAGAGSWPPPMRVDSADEQSWRRVAFDDGRPVGVLIARPVGDALDLDGVAVLPAWRGRGIGRALLTAAMREAAARRLGLTLRLGHLVDERDGGTDSALRWASLLGFWTYRTWSWFRLG